MQPASPDSQPLLVVARIDRLARSLFHDTVARLAFLLLPVGIGLSVLAQPFIVGLFTDKFQAGVPIFSVWALTVLPAIVAVDAVLREIGVDTVRELRYRKPENLKPEQAAMLAGLPKAPSMNPVSHKSAIRPSMITLVSSTL